MGGGGGGGPSEYFLLNQESAMRLDPGRIPIIQSLVYQAVTCKVRGMADLCVIASQWSASLSREKFAVVFDFLEADFPMVHFPFGVVISASGFMSLIQVSHAMTCDDMR